MGVGRGAKKKEKKAESEIRSPRPWKGQSKTEKKEVRRYYLGRRDV